MELEGEEGPWHRGYCTSSCLHRPFASAVAPWHSSPAPFVQPHCQQTQDFPVLGSLIKKSPAWMVWQETYMEVPCQQLLPPQNQWSHEWIWSCWRASTVHLCNAVLGLGVCLWAAFSSPMPNGICINLLEHNSFDFNKIPFNKFQGNLALFQAMFCLF